MSEKNWFMTPNHRLVDLNSYTEFAMTQNKVYGICLGDDPSALGTFETKEEAMECLYAIHDRLRMQKYPWGQKDE